MVIYSIISMLLVLIESSPDTPQTLVDFWAQKIGKKIRRFSENCTGFNEVKKSYENLNLEIEKVNGEKLASALSSQLETFFGGKVKALQDLANEASEAEQIFRDEEKDFHYFNGKELTQLNLTYDPNFGVPVNFNASIVHVPTEVYDKGLKAARDIKWTKDLNKVFQRNFERYPGLSWQYFGSAEGIHRQYPGRKWPLPAPGVPDLYDARRRPWYIQGASSPKDVIILIDRSGSLLGARIEIARFAARVIIDTLTTNDFFHVVVFNDKSELICCDGNDEDGPKLMQATRGNKEYVKGFLKSMTAFSTANWKAGMTTSLKLLQDNKLKGSKCQQVLIILSDGSANYEEDVLKKYDPKKEVRIFTYVVGAPQYGTEEMREIACNHHGFFLRISSVSAVWETVTSYIRVLSRPIGLTEDKPSTFTSVFVDATGSGLVSTGSIPVFKKSTSELLGVMATDIPVKDLSEFIFYPLIGHNGYVFVIDNNGLILIHPGINGKKLANLNPQPNMDVEELEFSVSSSHLVHQMRNHMITAKRGTKHHISYEAHVKSSNELRVRRDFMNYYYMRSNSSPFSIGIVSPDYGFIIRKPRVSYEKGATYLANVSRIKRWPYCSQIRNNADLKETLIKKLRDASKEKKELKNCELNMIDGLLIDSYATSILPEIWKEKEEIMKINDVYELHIRTHWGVIRTYNDNNGSLPIAEKVSEEKEEDLSVSPWDFYARAIRKPYDWIVSVPLQEQGLSSRDKKPHVSIYQPVRLDKQGVTTAVTGIEMSYSTFVKQYFIEVTRECPNDQPLCDGRITCDREKRNQIEALYCYILDENAFVVASNEQEDTGTFFGLVDSKIMSKLIETNKSYSLYDVVILPDYQASCKLYDDEHSSATILTTPIKSIVSASLTFLQAIISCLGKISVASVWNTLWNRNLADASRNREFTYVNCLKNTTIYLANNDAKRDISFQGNATCSSTDHCIRKFTVSSIPGSNLFLTVVDSNCGKCKEIESTPDEPGQVALEDDDAHWLRKAKILTGPTYYAAFTGARYTKPPEREKVRRNPSKCYGKDTHDAKAENESHCGGDNMLNQSYLIIIFVIYVVIII